jgi:hypothetical protein
MMKRKRVLKRSPRAHQRRLTVKMIRRRVQTRRSRLPRRRSTVKMKRMRVPMKRSRVPRSRLTAKMTKMRVMTTSPKRERSPQRLSVSGNLLPRRLPRKRHRQRIQRSEKGPRRSNVVVIAPRKMRVAMKRRPRQETGQLR